MASDTMQTSAAVRCGRILGVLMRPRRRLRDVRRRAAPQPRAAREQRQGRRRLRRPDGKLLVGGDFTTFAGTPAKGLVRLGAGGTLDRNFTPSIAGSVLSQAVTPTGEVIVGGHFIEVDGHPRHDVARLLR